MTNKNFEFGEYKIAFEDIDNWRIFKETGIKSNLKYCYEFIKLAEKYLFTKTETGNFEYYDDGAKSSTVLKSLLKKIKKNNFDLHYPFIKEEFNLVTDIEINNLEENHSYLATYIIDDNYIPINNKDNDYYIPFKCNEIKEEKDGKITFKDKDYNYTFDNDTNIGKLYFLRKNEHLSSSSAPTVSN